MLWFRMFIYFYCVLLHWSVPHAQCSIHLLRPTFMPLHLCVHYDPELTLGTHAYSFQLSLSRLLPAPRWCSPHWAQNVTLHGLSTAISLSLSVVSFRGGGLIGGGGGEGKKKTWQCAIWKKTHVTFLQRTWGFHLQLPQLRTSMANVGHSKMRGA